MICETCGKKLSKSDDFYKVTLNSKNYYFCSKDEYQVWREAYDKEVGLWNSIRIAAEEAFSERLTSQYWNILKSTLENKGIANDYSLEQILNYIKSDSDRIGRILRRKVFNSTFHKLKYFSAIICNAIQEYYELDMDIPPAPQISQSVQDAQTSGERKEVDFYMAPINYRPSRKRRAMINIEDDGED